MIIEFLKEWVAEQFKRITRELISSFFLVIGLSVIALTLYFFWYIVDIQSGWEKLWAWIETAPNEDTSGGSGHKVDSGTLRNRILIVIGLTGVILAIWRSIVAHRQTQVSELGLLNERYQKGAEMLGSKTLATRMGGIYALERLAREHPNEYHLQIMDLLCAFIRHPTVADLQCPPDVKAAALAIGRRKMRQIRIENKEEDWHLDLRNANLSGVTLITPDGINFEGALLIGANLLGASLVGAKLSNAHFMSANLSNANLSGTHLSQVELYKANLSSSKLIGSINLTQYQLNRGYIWEGEQSPDLHHAFCKDTGKLLIWENEPRPKPETDEQR